MIGPGVWFANIAFSPLPIIMFAGVFWLLPKHRLPDSGRRCSVRQQHVGLELLLLQPKWRDTGRPVSEQRPFLTNPIAWPRTVHHFLKAVSSSKTHREFFHGALRPQKPYGLLGTCEGGGGGRLYTYRYTVTTRMTLTLRRAAMRAILMFHLL